MLQDYEFDPESKCAGSHGNVGTKQEVWLLHRRYVEVDSIIDIAKESNRLEEVEAGLI